MSPVRLAIFVYCVLVHAVAGAADGTVQLYLQPIPSAAARLTFGIASVSAVSADGAEQPLKVNLKVVDQADAGRQRLLATGRLPAGRYAGFSVRIAQATVRREQGTAALAVPPAPLRLDAPFTVSGQEALLFWLALKYPESVAAGSEFNALFSVAAPTRPIAGNAGFVTSPASNTITVFDKYLKQAVALIDVCAGPAGMALDERRRRLYVACEQDDEIVSIDAATGGILSRARLSPGDRPRELALTPDGATLVSANTGSNSICIFDAASLTRRERLSVGSGPSSVLIDPTGRRAFVFNTLSSSVSIVDLAGRALVGTLSMDSAPVRGQFSGRGDRLYVIHERSPFMTVVDPRQLSTVTKARLGGGAGAITVDRIRNLVCVGDSTNGVVEFYDPNALVPLYSLRTRAAVSYLTIDAVDNNLYMASPDTRSVVVGRLADRKIVAEIDVGDIPYWVAVMGEK